MKKLLLLVLLIALSACVKRSLAADPFVLPELPKNGKTQLHTTWANGKPVQLWIRWLDGTAVIQCWHLDLGQYIGILPTEWKNIEDVATDIAIHNLVDNNATDAQKKDCYVTAVPQAWLDAQKTTPISPPLPPVPTPPPAPSWKVAVNNDAPDRPMKSGPVYEACLVDNAVTDKKLCDAPPYWVDLKSGSTVQRAKVGEPCEDKVVKTYTTKQSWHYSKSTAGIRGLVVCELR